MTTPSVVSPPDSANLKRCSTCGEWKPATPEFFNRDRGLRDGLNARCKQCRSRYSKQYYAANKEHERERGRAYRAANLDKVRERSRAYRSANPDKMREYYAANADKLRADARERWRQNRDERIAQNRAWRAANKDSQREYKRKYYQEHIEEVREYKRQWNEENRARKNENYRQWYVANTERQREYHREWSKANRAKRTWYTARRRARKRFLPDTLTAADWQAALDHFGGCCAACGRPPGLWHAIVPDHWIPLVAADCPGTVPWNIVPLCHTTKDGEGGCNNSKRHREAAEWLADAFGPRKGRVVQRHIEAWLNANFPPRNA